LNYIGSKAGLVGPLITRAMAELGIAPPGIFVDALAGTHAVGRAMQHAGWSVIANDQMRYSEVVGRALLGTKVLPFSELAGKIFLAGLPGGARSQAVIAHLAEQLADPEAHYIARIHGSWFLDKYCEGGSGGRLYFSRDNGKRIQIARWLIDEWPLTAYERDTLIYAVMRGADKVANTASVFYTFLKQLKPSARKPLKLEAPSLATGPEATVRKMELIDFLQNLDGATVVYIDPPYNARQYAPNYHLLETICCWDDPVAFGRGGLRDYSTQKSNWCYRSAVHDELDTACLLAPAHWVLLSYSSEGLMERREIADIMGRHGPVRIFEHEHPRFRADNDGPHRQYARNRTVVEYLFALRKL